MYKKKVIEKTLCMFELIKACFGIRSASLANYLRLSVDMMNSVLSNRRGLDLEQWWALTNLHEALKKDTALEELEHIVSFRTEQVAIAQQHLLGEIRRLERMLERREAKLEQLQKVRRARLRGLHACISLLQTDLDAHKREWMELTKKHLRWRLEESSLLKEQLLEAEIRGIETRIEWLKPESCNRSFYYESIT